MNDYKLAFARNSIVFLKDFNLKGKRNFNVKHNVVVIQQLTFESQYTVLYISHAVKN